MIEQEYWAAEPDEALPDLMKRRIRFYSDHIRDTGRLRLWQRSSACYYGYDPDGGWARSSAVSFGGEQGETTLVRINHYGALIRLVHVYISGTRPAFESRAANNDSDSVKQVAIADTLLDYNLTHGGFEDAALKALRFALRNCEGWLEVGWDSDAGEDYAADELGNVAKSGAPRFLAHHPIDVIRDPMLRSCTAFPWLILRRWESRWDMMAKYPEHAQMLRDLATNDSTRYGVDATWRDKGAQGTANDRIPVFELHHPSSLALPGGRFALMAGDKLLGPSTPYPFPELPLILMTPEEEEDMPFGFSNLLDLLAPQIAYDSVMSTQVTNHDAFGVQSVWTKKGDDLDVEMLSGGMRHMQSIEKPEPVQLTATSEHSYKLRDQLKEDIDALAAMPSIARGEESGSVKSGSHAALVHSLALQAQSGGQRTYAAALERAASLLIRLYQEFGSTPRTAELVGSENALDLKSFTGKDVQSVQRVEVNLADPVTRTADARKEIADKFMATPGPNGAPLITAPQYFDIIKTGRLEQTIDPAANEQENIRAENERLVGGKPVLASKTDDPIQHLLGHKAVLDRPATREDQVLFAAVAAHIDEHMQIWMNTTMNEPALLHALGLPPFPAQAGPPPPANDNGQAAAPQGAPPTANDNADPERAQVPGADQVDQSKMPLMPVDPSSGERAAAGGMS